MMLEYYYDIGDFFSERRFRENQEIPFIVDALS